MYFRGSGLVKYVICRQANLIRLVLFYLQMGESMQTKRETNESYDDYSYRLYKNRQLYGLKNEEVADLIKQEFGITKDESAIRKDMTSYIRGFDNGYEKGIMDSERKEMDNPLIPKSHLSKLKEITGEYAIRKRDMELTRLELSRLNRQVVPSILLAEQYENHLLEYGINVFNGLEFKEKKQGTCVIKSLPSDWHIGVVIDEEYNTYNYAVAERRMREYTEEVLNYAKLFNAHTISITSLGDVVENTEMRGNQKFDCEFNYAEQVAKAQDLLMQHIMDILAEGYKVDLSAVYGNHCRMTGNKNDSIDTSNATYVIMENIKKTFDYLSQYSGKKFDISFVQKNSKYKYHSDNYYGFKIRYQHGHNDSKADTSKIEKYNGVDDESYDALVFGHLHHFRLIQLNRNQFEMYCSCLQGSNEYGRDVVKSTANAGQSIIVIFENGTALPINIDLQ